METIRLTMQDALNIVHEGYAHHDFRLNEVEGIVCDFGNLQCVDFRGTEFTGALENGGIWDIIRDARTLPWHDKRVGWSHAGFLKGARVAVDGYLNLALDLNRPVAFFGHSLGAGLAINAAAMMKNMGWNVVFMFGLGAPRTLRRRTQRKFEKLGIQTHLFANPGDPVDNVPPPWLGFRHAVELTRTARPGQGFPGISHNHMMPHYVEALVGEYRNETIPDHFDIVIPD